MRAAMSTLLVAASLALSADARVVRSPSLLYRLRGGNGYNLEDEYRRDDEMQKPVLGRWRNPMPSFVHDSVITTIGSTPLIRLTRLEEIPDGVEVYVKAEGHNPGGSVKDRLAIGAITWAEQTGELQQGMTVVEASSGNTGIGLALVCAAKGYPFVCVMSESFSIERRKLMRYLGAKVVLTNPAHKGSGMVIKARELAEKHGWFRPRQFESEANAWIHKQTTGPEILEALGSRGRRLDDFVCAYGTGGTLNGVGAELRRRSNATKVTVCEPDNAPLLYSGEPTKYDENGEFVAPHPVWRPHLLQGWAPDFVPKLVDDATTAKLYDSVMHVGGERALQVACEDTISPPPFPSARRGFMRPVPCCCGVAGGARAREEGGSAHRPIRRRVRRVRPRDREEIEARLDDRGDAPGHGRALPLDSSLRRHTRRHDGGGEADR